MPAVTTARTGGDTSADAPAAVTIFDEITLPAISVDHWLATWRTEYLPGARDRGLQLTGAWRGFTQDPDAVAVVIQWTLPSVGAFFAARGNAGADPAVAAFWAATDEIAIHRDRRVMQDAGMRR